MFGPQKLCLEGPLTVEVVPRIFAPIEHPQLPAGSMQVIEYANEVRRPPAPDDFGCGHWAPRFLNSDGGRLS